MFKKFAKWLQFIEVPFIGFLKGKITIIRLYLKKNGMVLNYFLVSNSLVFNKGGYVIMNFKIDCIILSCRSLYCREVKLLLEQCDFSIKKIKVGVNGKIQTYTGNTNQFQVTSVFYQEKYKNRYITWYFYGNDAYRFLSMKTQNFALFQEN